LGQPGLIQYNENNINCNVTNQLTSSSTTQSYSFWVLPLDISISSLFILFFLDQKKMWNRMNFQEEAVQVMNSDFKDLSEVASRLANHAIKFAGIGWGGSFFGFFAAVAAMYVAFNSFQH